MDVGNLLELECTFERRGVVVSAPQVDEIMGIGEDFRQIANLLVDLQHLGKGLRQFEQRFRHLAEIVVAHRAPLAAYRKGQHGHDGHLTGESLGRSHADLGPHVDVGTRIGSPGDGGAHDVADAEDEGAGLAGQLHGGQRIGRFA